MSFRRKSNSHDAWLLVVRENALLLSEIPPEALATKAAFRDYVTRGVIDGRTVAPGAFDLSSRALRNLHVFMNDKAQFDMDVILFDKFNEAFRLLSNTENAPGICQEGR